MPEPIIKVKDKRSRDAITGKEIPSTLRKHANIPEEHLNYVVKKAKQYGIDPYTALAINLQETGFDQKWAMNPFQLGKIDMYGDVIDQSLKFMKEKFDLGKKLGKKTEEEIIQAYNGYGTLKDQGVMYGIDTSANPINMKENPLYGKRIINLRDSVLRKDPDFVKRVETVMAMPEEKKPFTLKNGGLKTGRKKMNDGGIKSVPFENLSIPELAKYPSSTDLMPTNNPVGKVGAGNPDVVRAGNPDVVGGILSSASEAVPKILDSFAPEYTDMRENPSEVLKSKDALGTAGNVAGSTLKGAATGLSVAGPVGGVVGGALGLVTSGISALLNTKKKREERREATEKWAGAWSNKYAEAYENVSYKKGGEVLTTRKPVPSADSSSQGGKIKGDGTAKSDSIQKRIEDGSFVVPAKNADKAMNLGREYLDWDGNEMAGRSYPGTEVKVSNGEVLFTPEEVSILSYNGVDLNKLAPEAENKIEPGAELTNGTKFESKNPLQNTGYIYDKIKKMQENINLGKDAPNTLRNSYIDLPDDGKGAESVQEKSFIDKLGDVAPEIAGAIQVGAGIVGLQKAGRMPDVNVSTALRDLAAEQRMEASYGLEPGAKTAMKISTERARRNATNAITGRGGSASEVISNLQGVMSTSINDSYQIELADAAEKARKKGEASRTRQMIGQQEFDAQQIALNNWKEMQEINANLLSAGIANIVGARKLKTEMDAMKDIKERGEINWSNLVPRNNA